MQNPKNDENLPKSTIFEIFRESARTRTETPQERAAGAQHLRSLATVSVAIKDRRSRARQKHYGFLADTAWHRFRPETATTRPNRRDHVLRAPFEGK